jgi:hypothetical protein
VSHLRVPASPPPPITAPAALVDAVRAKGWAVVDAAGLAAVAVGGAGTEARPTQAAWDDLPADAYLKDGGRYRFRRHASFVVATSGIERVAHRAHWQSTAYNALHGGIERWFEPIADDVGEAITPLLGGLADVATRCRGGDGRWFVEAHQFRIDAADGLGRPTPEGAHRDGVDFAVVVLVDRKGVVGGETRVFDIDGPAGVRFTLTEPWSALFLDDERVIHETTPISAGHRDTLVVTLRRGGFQQP